MIIKENLIFPPIHDFRENPVKKKKIVLARSARSEILGIRFRGNHTFSSPHPDILGAKHDIADDYLKKKN